MDVNDDENGQGMRCDHKRVGGMSELQAGPAGRQESGLCCRSVQVLATGGSSPGARPGYPLPGLHFGLERRVELRPAQPGVCVLLVLV